MKMRVKLTRLGKELGEEFLEELIKTMPREMQIEFMRDLEQAKEEAKTTFSSESDMEDEFKRIDCLEQTVMRFVNDKCEDLSHNGMLLLMFKISTGIDSALKEFLGEEEHARYKATFLKSEELRKKHREEMDKIMEQRAKEYMKESADLLKGLFD